MNVVRHNDDYNCHDEPHYNYHDYNSCNYCTDGDFDLNVHVNMVEKGRAMRRMTTEKKMLMFDVGVVESDSIYKELMM